MSVAIVIDVVGPHDVGMVQGSGSAGLAMEAGQVGGVGNAVLRQDLDGHPPLHEHVLAQVDRAHSARAQLAQKFIAAEKEAAPLAFQQSIALPRGDKVLGDEPPRDFVHVGRELAARLLFQLRNEPLEPVFFHQPTALHQVEECFDVGFGHAHTNLAAGTSEASRGGGNAIRNQGEKTCTANGSAVIRTSSHC